jgi:hypothetical protein
MSTDLDRSLILLWHGIRFAFFSKAVIHPILPHLQERSLFMTIPPIFGRLASRRSCFGLLLVASALAVSSVAQPASASTLIAYWDQNSNNLPVSGFGFAEGAFPQAASLGTGSLSVGGGLFLDTTFDATNNVNVYSWIKSFAGSAVNAQPGVLAGGSISPEGGTDTGNNGGYFQFAFSMAGLTDLDISYATRRTSSGFTSQTWSWSTDGDTFTTFQTVDSITTSSTFDLKQFSGPAALDNAATAFLRVTFDGATASNGNNRLDNITLTAVPEPSTVVLAAVGVGLVGFVARRRQRHGA